METARPTRISTLLEAGVNRMGQGHDEQVAMGRPLHFGSSKGHQPSAISSNGRDGARPRETAAAGSTALGVLAQFERRGDDYVATPAGPNLDADKGIRRKGSTLQLGLTTYEIKGVRDRLEALIKVTDRGKVKTF